MGSIVSVVCLLIGLLFGFALGSINHQETPDKDKEPSLPPKPDPPAKSKRSHSLTQQQQEEDESLDELKDTLMKLFETLSTAINDLQEDSDTYTVNLEHQRASINESLSLDDLKSLGDELLQHVEVMHTSNTRYRSQLKITNDLVKQQQSEMIDLQLKAGTDYLTNTHNRASLDEHLKVMINISRRYGNTFSLMVLDIDHFKWVNDTLGHLAGDTVLREVARILKTYSRDSDFLARYGGEEFVYILPEMSSERALIMAEKLREHIENHEFTHTGKEIKITVSGGISAIISDTDNNDSIFKRADDALFKAKENGRNCIVIG